MYVGDACCGRHSPVLQEITSSSARETTRLFLKGHSVHEIAASRSICLSPQVNQIWSSHGFLANTTVIAHLTAALQAGLDIPLSRTEIPRAKVDVGPGSLIAALSSRLCRKSSLLPVRSETFLRMLPSSWCTSDSAGTLTSRSGRPCVLVASHPAQEIKFVVTHEYLSSKAGGPAFVPKRVKTE